MFLGGIEQLLEPSSLFPASGCLFFFFHSPPYVLYCMHGERRQGPIAAAVGTTPKGHRPPPPLRARLWRRRRRRRGLFRSLNIPPSLPPICARFSLWKREEVIFRPLPPSLTSGAASLFVRSDGGWKCDNNGVSSQPAAGAGERERESPLFDLDGAGIRQR